jgi:uncharacterized membrane protein YfcA
MDIDGGMAAVAAAAALAGLVRGYTGFGAAMVFVPVASVLYGPMAAVAWIFLVDLPPTVPLVMAALRKSDGRAIAWLALGACLAIPFGVWSLTALPEETVRWIIALVILAAVGALATGWRYRRRPGRATSFAVGGASGYLGGLASLYGPPVILFWLSGQDNPERVRANVMVYFGVTTVISGVSLWAAGLFNRDVLLGALALAPIYGATIWLGARAFRALPERLFRPFALALIAAAAIGAMPVWS